MFPLQGGLEGSVLTYHCGPGQYPFPVSYRLCGADGEWSLMRIANGRPVSRATCKGNVVDDDGFFMMCTQKDCCSQSEFSLKTPLCDFLLLFSTLLLILHPLFCLSFSLPLSDVLCPAQIQLDHGDFWPRNQWFRVGTAQTFSCLEGFTLYGSAQRHCTLSGEWTGTTPVCDNHGEEGDDYKPSSR